MHRLLPSLLVVALVALPALAAADRASERGAVAIIAVEIAGDAAPELKNQLQMGVMRGIDAAKRRGVSLDEVLDAVRERPELIGCTSTTCLAQIGELVGARQFIRVRVQASGATYTAELELLSPREGEAVQRRLEKSCTVCTITELHQLVAEAATALLVGKDTAAATVELVTSPAGATLRLDERELGAAPQTLELEAGTYTVQARLEGYMDGRQTIEVKPGAEPQRFEIVLSKRPDELPPPPPEQQFRIWKWAAAGGAVVSLGLATYLFTIDGDMRDCDRLPMQTQCPDLVDGVTPGIFAAIIGVGLGGASGWMFWQDMQTEEPRTQTAIVPTRGGAMGTLRVRF